LFSLVKKYPGFEEGNQVLVAVYEVTEAWHVVIMLTTVHRLLVATFLDIEEEDRLSFKQDDI
jgi:hypothetical protein